MTYTSQSKPTFYVYRRVISFAAVVVFAVMPITGCHSLVDKLNCPLSQTLIAQERFNGSPACDSLDACAGFTETNWTPLPSCTHWESSFDEVPILYDEHEHVSVQDEPRRHSSAPLALPFQRQVTNSEVQQANYSVDDNTASRDTGINDEVYEYAKSCLGCEESMGQSNDNEMLSLETEGLQSEVQSVNEKQLDEVSIEYLQ